MKNSEKNLWQDFLQKSIQNPYVRQNQIQHKTLNSTNFREIICSCEA